MTIVKELNELAERMTGTNPKATTDAMAMNYIEQNYSGGSSGGDLYTIDLGNVTTTKTNTGELQIQQFAFDETLDESNLIAKLEEIKNKFLDGKDVKVLFKFNAIVNVGAEINMEFQYLSEPVYFNAMGQSGLIFNYQEFVNTYQNDNNIIFDGYHFNLNYNGTNVMFTGTIAF